MRKLFAILLSVLLVCSLFAGCGKKAESVGSGTTEQTSGEEVADATEETDGSAETADVPDYCETGTLNLSWPSDYGTDLLPFPWSGRNIAVAMLFDPLVSLDADGITIVPKIASDWTVSDDGLTYTFTIRDDILWHDGEALTPEDVAFSLNGYIQNPTSEYPGIFTLIEGGTEVAAGEADACTGIGIDGNVITIQLTSARNDFLTYCAIVSILPEHILGEEDATLLSQNEAFLKNPIGCGAYKVETVNIPNYFTVVRNDDYYAEAAGVKNVTFTSYSEGGADASTAAIIAGGLDIISNVGDMSRAENIQKNNGNIESVIIAANYARYFVFNTAGATDGNYNDDIQKTEVRQAINLLLDKQAIAGFYGGLAAPLTTFVNPDSSYYNSDIPLFERDVDTAVQMLEDAGFDFTRTVRIAYYYSDQTTADIMALVVQNFADAGIKAEANVVTGSIVDVVYNQHNWDLCYFGNYGLDAVDSFYYNLRTPTGLFKQIQGDYELDVKAEFSNLYTDFYQVNSEEEKQDVLNQFQIRHLETMYTIPLYAINKIEMHNAAKLSYPDGLFALDILDWLDYRFETWKLLAE